ncbi:MAG: DUF2187 family protein [Bacillota bacterium]|nr:DUF2187 family protein [Bacillota bacterium]
MNLDSIMVKEGDKVLFKRKDFTIIGEVLRVKEESVIVQISNSDAELIDVQTPLTVVSHKHYKKLS